MRKHTARHWLHAVLDLLPVLLIPVFMIYSHRHDMTQQTEVDIQYKYQSNEVNSLDDIQDSKIYQINYDLSLENFIDDDFSINVIEGNIYVNSEDFFELDTYYSVKDFTLSYVCDDYRPYIYLNGYSYNCSEFFINSGSIIQIENVEGFLFCYYAYEGESFDYRNLVYTDFNVIENVEVNDVTNSVMNVFIDNFNNAINKYFNMGNVFGMTNVYQWFNTNIFGGNAPTIIYSVWNIVLYEFVMDLIFLLYALFMWFIDMTKRLIEKPLDSIK